MDGSPQGRLSRNRANPYMLFSMRHTTNDCSPKRLGFGFHSPLPSFAEASVASRSERRQRGVERDAAQRPRPGPLLICPCVLPFFLLFLPRQEIETAAPAQGAAVACASSSNPRTVFDQSVAQPEPHTPSAQNSNRCQSAGFGPQLVYVRMS